MLPRTRAQLRRALVHCARVGEMVHIFQSEDECRLTHACEPEICPLADHFLFDHSRSFAEYTKAGARVTLGARPFV